VKSVRQKNLISLLIYEIWDVNDCKADEGTGEKILCSPQDGQPMDSLFYNSNYRKNLKNKNKN
jgi:hypothetical protein